MGGTWQDVFDCMRLINLPERRDRLRESRAELRLAGLEVGFGPGQVEVFEAVRPPERGEFPSVGCLGCFASHLQILREALERDVERLLVMEDDVALTPLFRDPPPGLVEAVAEADWDLLWLGHVLEMGPDGNSAFAMPPYDGELLQTHLYAVHRRAMASIVTFFETLQSRPFGHPDGGPMPIDGAYNTFREAHPEFKTLVVAPSLARQRSSRSDHYDAVRWFDRWPGARQLVAQGRSAKEWLVRHQLLGGSPG